MIHEINEPKGICKFNIWIKIKIKSSLDVIIMFQLLQLFSHCLHVQNSFFLSLALPWYTFY